MLAAGVVLIAPSAVSRGVPSASADDCPDAEVTFARGTDEPPGLGRVGQALVDSLRQQTGMNIGVYAVNYKASLLQLHTDDGSKDAVSHIKSMADKCPNTPQVLGGYSQGASVMDIVTGDSVGGILRGTALPAQYANIVAAVVTFGNVADRSGLPITTQSPLFGSRAIDLCNPTDPICHPGPGNEWTGHTEGYVPIYTDPRRRASSSRRSWGSNLPLRPGLLRRSHRLRRPNRPLLSTDGVGLEPTTNGIPTRCYPRPAETVNRINEIVCRTAFLAVVGTASVRPRRVLSSPLRYIRTP